MRLFVDFYMHCDVCLEGEHAAMLMKILNHERKDGANDSGAGLGFHQVLKNEMEQLKSRRAGVNRHLEREGISSRVVGEYQYLHLEDAISESGSIREAHHTRPLGVCFSGGGIRSATFNLGLLQGLCQQGLLPYVDYLSTVSGGGYIGSWLHGVIRNKFHGDPVSAGRHLTPGGTPGDADSDPVTFLRKYSNYLAPRSGLFSPDRWTIAAVWLRNMLLNLLIILPFIGAVVLLTRWLGMVAILYVPDKATAAWDGFWMLPVACSVGIISWCLCWIAFQHFHQRLMEFPPDQTKSHPHEIPPIANKWSWAAVATTMMAAYVLGIAPHALDADQDHFIRVLFTMSVLFLVLQTLGGFPFCFWQRHSSGGKWQCGAQIVLWSIAIPLICAAATAALMSLAWHWLYSLDPNATPSTSMYLAWRWLHFLEPDGPSFTAVSWLPLIIGPALMVLIWKFGVILQMGLMGGDFPDSAREWLSKFGSLLLIASLLCSAVVALSVYGPLGLLQLALHHDKVFGSTLLFWVLSGVGSYFAGLSSKTSEVIGSLLSLLAKRGGKDTSLGPGESAPRLEAVAAVAPPVFMVLTFLMVALGAHLLVGVCMTWPATGSETRSPEQIPPETMKWVALDSNLSVGLIPKLPKGEDVDPPSTFHKWLVRENNQYWCYYPTASQVCDRSAQPAAWAPGASWSLLGRSASPADATLFLSLGGFAITLLLSFRVNINEFSMHNFYKNRLVRCYLGASKAKTRQANRLTGFDPNDDFPLSSLDPSHQYFGPCPILNCALNVNVGTELATAERKSESFVFTPRACGFEPKLSQLDKRLCRTKDQGGLSRHGYRETRNFLEHPWGPDLGKTMAISGAAGNPNCGYHTSTPLAFLMTFFDIRMGWWVGNPRRAKESGREGPRVALLTLLSELFALTTSRSAYVNLSDGGHFENLGLYELVRRRCRYIIVGDGEADPNYSFEALGSAIRKCRADFGVEISLDTDPLKLKAGQKVSACHCVVGTIRYPETQHGRRPDPMCEEVGETQEPSDQIEGWLVYFKANMTGDEPEDIQQYQTEHPLFPQESSEEQFFGESQFESYRRLGEHVLASTFERIHNQASDKHHEPHRDHLLGLFQDLYRKWHAPVAAEKGSNFTERYTDLMNRLGKENGLQTVKAEFFPFPLASRKDFDFCLEVIQLMEDVYFELDFANKANRGKPEYYGWVKTFRTWAASEAVQGTWEAVKQNYNKLFQDFLEEELIERANGKSRRGDRQ